MTKDEHAAGAATDAAAITNAANAMRDAITALPGLLAQALAHRGDDAVAQPAAAAGPVTPRPRDLRDRRVPDFWEHDPAAWFQVLDDHFSTATTPLTELAKFKILLPLLATAAVKKVSRFIATPPATVYTLARTSLIRHFERPKEEMIKELIGLTSLGDRTAVDFLEHMRTLQPGEAENSLFRHIFVRSLPKYVGAIVSDKEDLDDMATAADVILRTVPLPPNVPVQEDLNLAAVASTHPRSQLVDGLCHIHAQWGRDSYHCALPDSCRMKDVVRPRPTGNRRR